MENLTSPLRSLWKTVKNKYKLDYIPTWRKITSLGKFQGSWFHSLFLQRSWFHLNTEKWPKNVELWWRNEQHHCVRGVEKCWNHIKFVKIWQSENMAHLQNPASNYVRSPPLPRCTDKLNLNNKMVAKFIRNPLGWVGLRFVCYGGGRAIKPCPLPFLHSRTC